MKKIILLLFFIPLSQFLIAQEELEEEKTLSLKASRSFNIKTDEGTWMSVDVHPNGDKIIFDLLGDIYELPIEGGRAKRVTEGIAFDSQPKYSPDGNSILFLSDRSGGNNVWILNRKEKTELSMETKRA